MKKQALAASFSLLLLAACVVTPGPGGYGVTVAPALPSVVVLDESPYYYQGGYYYLYQNNGWSYSRSKGGPWAELPRSHWPKEIRHKGRDEDRGRDNRREHEWREHEERGYERR